MNPRVALVLTIAFACCNAPAAIAQAKGKKAPLGGVGFPGGTGRVVDELPPGPAFLVTLEERSKPRKVFLPYPVVGDGAAAREPYVATVYAMRRIQGNEPAKAYVYISIAQAKDREFPEEDIRKILQFKKDFANRKTPLAEGVEAAKLTLNSHGLTMDFDLKTGDCTGRSFQTFQIPDGFFDALSDALGDLEKLKAAKPAFQVK